MRREICAILLAASPLLALAAGTTGCAKHPQTDPPRVDVTMPAPPARTVPGANRALIDDFKKAGVDAREVQDGIVVYLPAVFQFSFDDAVVAPEARRKLHAVAKLLLAGTMTTRRVVIEGHTDGVGAASYNQTLSARRADAVSHELQTAGLARTRITRRAFGASKPVEPNRKADGTDNPTGRARNRRVTMLIENPTDSTR
jgi:outer membrane protein OmpA-like peptidoglycan-associated protein